MVGVLDGVGGSAVAEGVVGVVEGLLKTTSSTSTSLDERLGDGR